MWPTDRIHAIVWTYSSRPPAHRSKDPALPAAGQRFLDRPGVHAHAEGLLDPVGQLRRAQRGAGGKLLLGPGEDLLGQLVGAARPGPGGHQPFQPRRFQRGGRGVYAGQKYPNAAAASVTGAPRALDLAHHLVLDLHRVPGVEEVAAQELRVGHLLRMRVQAPRGGQRRLLGVVPALLPGHTASSSRSMS